jgi:8-oxo-dGTP pyrophosphatase MutT (NUDIX family)
VRPDDVRRALIELPPLPYDPRSLLLPDARDAAVLVALRFDVRGPVAYIVERSSGMRDHAGELGFFGGKLDDGETAEEAALREAGEEAGLEPGEVELLGRLSPVPVITPQVPAPPVRGGSYARSPGSRAPSTWRSSRSSSGLGSRASR